MNKTTDEVLQAADTAKHDAKATVLIQWLIGVPIFFGIPYRVWVWNNLPEDLTVRWLITGGILVVVLVAVCFWQAKTVLAFRTARDVVVLLAIVAGASLAALYYATPDRTLILKLFVIAYFSFLPPWLYVQFLSSRGRTLWEDYVLNLFRLQIDLPENLPEPPKESRYHALWANSRAVDSTRAAAPPGGTTPPEPVNVYEKRFAGHFGEGAKSGRGLPALGGGNMVPVAMAAMLVSIGWVLVVQLDSIWGHQGFGVQVKSDGTFAVPLDAIRFGFLGSYFYIVQMLVRRYFQNDLKPGAYVNATLRIVIVFLLVWVVADTALADARAETRAATAFVIGVFPQVAWQLIVALLKLPAKVVVPSLDQVYPLSDLDGLNVWYESRLLEEGVEDMQNLATADLVEVMLNTRVPVDRLVDWVDQSMLYLHVAHETPEKSAEGAPAASNGHESARETLRRFGIRAATDVDEVLRVVPAVEAEADGRGAVAVTEATEFRTGMLRILNNGKDEPSVLLSVSRSLENEPNLFHVRAWKRIHRNEVSAKTA